MKLHPVLWLPLQIGMTIPCIIFECTFIYLFIGAKTTIWSNIGGGLIGAVSIAAIQLVFIYQSPWWREQLAKHYTLTNFCLFSIANFAFTFVEYFFSVGLIMLVTQRPFSQASIGVVLHQQLIFFTQSFNTNCFNGFDVIPGNAFTKSVFWYLIGWLFWMPFAVSVMDNSSYTNPALPNGYLWMGSAIGMANFTNLLKLNILAPIQYKFKTAVDQIGIVLFLSICGAMVQYCALFWIYYAVSKKAIDELNPTRMTFGGGLGNATSLLWVANAIVGATVAPWTWSCIKDKTNNVSLACYIIGNCALSWGVYVILHYIYHEIIFLIFFTNVFGMDKRDYFGREEYIYGFGCGNLYLVWNGIKFFSKTTQDSFKAQAQQEEES